MQKYLEQLKQQYNYNDKTIKALAKIIPALIKYYSIEYEEIILSALKETEIICCNSYQTISNIKEQEKLTPTIGTSEIKKIENDGIYLSNIKIIYNELQNKYEIIKLNRKIIISHTFNLDSPKGLEVLILTICRLIKSYNEEYQIEGNTLIHKEGLSKTIKKILKEEDKITLNIQEEKLIGLHIGSLLYDTEQIESIILKDKYNTHQYNYLKLIIKYIKENIDLKETITEDEILKDNTLKKIYDKEENYEKLSHTIDKCLEKEHNMLMFALNREEKNKQEKELQEILEKEIILELLTLKKQKDKLKRVKIPEY
jgi:hypothetical protein